MKPTKLRRKPLPRKLSQPNLRKKRRNLVDLPKLLLCRKLKRMKVELNYLTNDSASKKRVDFINKYLGQMAYSNKLSSFVESLSDYLGFDGVSQESEKHIKLLIIDSPDLAPNLAQ